jgi:hypothetical protein
MQKEKRSSRLERVTRPDSIVDEVAQESGGDTLKGSIKLIEQLKKRKLKKRKRDESDYNEELESKPVLGPGSL